MEIMHIFLQTISKTLVIIGILLASSVAVWSFELPPQINRDAETQLELEDTFENKTGAYEVRTHLFKAGKPKYVNRLIHEASPYLLQHAHNPVDWYSWSQEALNIAKQENKPIFLSIGYATCYWCHVMERESFDQEDVAEILNEEFISIKIDREQNPDLDKVYLLATKLQQGQAGWPNTLWLTPDGKPFHTGTYFNKEDLIRNSKLLAEGWKAPSARQEILQVAIGLSGQIEELLRPGSGTSVPISMLIIDRAVTALLEKHNEFEGGFSETNQFPQEAYLLFLMDYWRRGGSSETLDAVLLSLDMIAAGGIHDHVGGGFHRYAIDPGWQTPHFEKMLYNQALLSRAFTEAWEITHKDSYRRAAIRTFEYVIDKMTSKEAMFYSAQDAESLNQDGLGEEGAYYVWNESELGTLLQGEYGPLLADTRFEESVILRLDPTEQPNFEALDKQLKILQSSRIKRPSPFTDEKSISGWNGLMIRSLAMGSKAFGEPKYLNAAINAADAIWKQHWDNGNLKRFTANGESNDNGLLEDYVWLALGYVALSDVTDDEKWLDRAMLLTQVMTTKFGTNTKRLRTSKIDSPLGSVFSTSDDALPSAESSALELFGKLIHRTGDLGYFSQYKKLSDALSIQIAKAPEEMAYALMASRIPDEGDSLHRQVRGNGTVQIHLKEDVLELKIKKGWHLSAHLPGYDFLVGTNIKGAKAEWPKGKEAKLGFATQEAFVYEGILQIPIERTSDQVVVTVQACSDQICLAPEEAKFRFAR